MLLLKENLLLFFYVMQPSSWWETKKDEEQEKSIYPIQLFAHKKKIIGRCQMTFQQAMTTLQSFKYHPSVVFQIIVDFPFSSSWKAWRFFSWKSLCFSRSDLNESIVVCLPTKNMSTIKTTTMMMRKAFKNTLLQQDKYERSISMRLSLHFEYLNLLTNSPPSDRWDAIQIILIMIFSVIFNLFFVAPHVKN